MVFFLILLWLFWVAAIVMTWIAAYMMFLDLKSTKLDLEEKKKRLEK